MRQLQKNERSPVRRHAKTRQPRWVATAAAWLGLAAGLAAGGDVYWDGDTSATWGTGANWAGGVAPTQTETAIFDTGLYTPAYQPILGVATNLGALRFAAGTWSIGGGLLGTQYKLTLGGVGGLGITNGSGNNMVGSDVGLGAAQTWFVAPGTTLRVGGTVSGAYKLTVMGGGTLVLGGSSGFGLAGTGNNNVIGDGVDSTIVKLAGGPNTLGNAGTIGITVNAGALLDLNGNSQSVASYGNDGVLLYNTIYGAGDIGNTDPIRRSSLVVGANDAGSTTFDGRLRGNLSVLFGGRTSSRHLILTGGTNDFTGVLSLIAGRESNPNIYLRNAAQIGQAEAVNLYVGSLVLDDAGGATASADRLGNGVPVNLRGGALALNGKASTASAETTGVLTADFGAGALTATPGASGSATLSLNTLARGSRRGSLVLTAANLGGTARIQATAEPVVATTTGNGMVAPWVLVSTPQFATYDGVAGGNTGFKAATTTSGNFGAGQTATLLTLGGNQTLTADADVYALDANSRSILYDTTPRSVTVRSGGIINTGAGTYDCNLVFGAAGEAEGVIYNAAALSIGSVANNTGHCTTTNGLTKWGAGTLTLRQRTSGDGTAGNWRGVTTVNGGTLTFDAVAGNNGGDGKYFVPGDLTISGSVINNVYSGVATLTADNQVKPVSKVTLSGAALLNLNFNQTLAKVSFLDPVSGYWGGSVAIAGGKTLTLGGDAGYTGPDVVVAGAGVASTTFSGAGTLDLNGPRTLQADPGYHPGATVLNIGVFVTDSAGTHGLAKTGAGQIYLSNCTNSFAGSIAVNGGTLLGFVDRVTGMGDPNAFASTTALRKDVALNNDGALGIVKGGVGGWYSVPLGTLSFSGGNAFIMDLKLQGGGRFYPTFTNLNRVGRGTLLWRAINAGDSTTDVYILPSPAPSSSRGMLDPYLAMSKWTTPVDFTAWDAANTRIVPVTYNTPASGSLNDATATTIFRAAISQTLTADRTVEALRADADIGGAYTLTIQGNQAANNTLAGLILNQDVAIAANLRFGDTGAAEALVYVKDGSSATISGTVATTGGLTKFGPGRLTLTTDNRGTLGGGICVQQGILQASAANCLGANAIALQKYAALGLDFTASMTNAFTGAGRIYTGANTLTLAAGGSISPGATGGSSGTDTFLADNLDFRGTYNWDYAAGTNDVIACGTVAFGGSATLAIAGDPPFGTYTLFAYTGANPASLGSWSVTGLSRKVGIVKLDAAGKRVVLQVRPAPAGTTVLFF